MKAWLRLWRYQHVELRSPLASAEAQERLALTMTGGGGGGQTVVDEAGDDSGFLVVGRVAGPRVSLSAGRPGVRNVWRPVLRAHVVPSDPGCVVTGQLGWHPRVRTASLLWLVVDLGLAAVGIANVVKVDVEFDHARALRQLPLPVAALGLGGLFVALTSVASNWGRKDDQVLRDWLRQTLTPTVRTELPIPAAPIEIDLRDREADQLNTLPGERLSVPVG